MPLPLIAQTLPSDAGAGYVAAAYIAFVVLLVVYVGIMAARLGRISDEIESLAGRAERRQEPPGERSGPRDDAPAEVGAHEDAEP